MRTLLRQRLLASTIVAGAVAAAAPAFAQATTEAPTAPAASNPDPSIAGTTTSSDGSADAGAIVVTGSRIPHPELESASPVTLVGQQEFKYSGTTRVEDLLNSLPQVFAGQGSNVSNGATGTATVDLRNLGPNRTLVLVNGRRLTPGTPLASSGVGSAADINIIPSALVKRVDVLTGGASSVYGADAVSGVLNFVMDTEFDGFKLDGQYSFFQHNNRAGNNITGALNASNFGYPAGSTVDGGQVDTTAMFGAGFDDGRGHVTGYVGYRRINAVTQDRRDYSACSLTANTTAQAATRGGRLYRCGGSGTAFPANFYSQGAYYNAAGELAAPNVFNFAPTNYFQRPDERYTAGLFAHYDVSDAFKPYMEFMFMDDRTVAQIAPSGIFFNNSAINCDNPLLSSGLRDTICATGNTTVDANGVTRGSVLIGRRNVEGGGRQDDLQHTTYRGVIGAKGDIAKGISYDAYYQYSRVNLAETYRNDFSISRFNRSLDVVTDPATGNAVCRSALNGTDSACVPYNIFSAGGVTDAALAYLQTPGFARGQNTEQVANASLTFLGGEYGIASPFARDGLAVNVGFEYRKETLNIEYDTTFQSGDLAGQGTASISSSGAFDVKEGFIEASLPLVQDKPFFRSLTIGGGYRKSYYRIFNANSTFDTDTYKAEINWAPIRDLSLRGSYNRAVRSPNIVELFGPQKVGLDSSLSSDPCAGAVDTNGLVNGNTFAQCALTGVTAAQFGNIAPNNANQYNGFNGGNTNLRPEKADTFTAGVVLTPTFLRGFQATVDFFDIKIANQIGTIGGNTIISQCLAGDTSYCGLINRNAQGSLWRTNDGFVTNINTNTGKVSTRGVDVTVGYSHDIGNVGRLGFSLNGTWLDRLTYDPIGASKYNCVGYYGAQCGIPTPKWRHKARLTYTLPSGPSASLAWRYFAHSKDETLSSDRDLSGITLDGNARIKAVSYFDLAFTVPVGDHFTWRIGSNNLLDKQPPVVALGSTGLNGNVYSQVYDSLGRYIYTGITLDF